MNENSNFTPEELKKIQEKYGREIKVGKPGLNAEQKPIENQTDWIWFDREKLENLLNKTDPKNGGIKFYFGEYDESFEDKLGKEYVGRLTLAMVPSNLDTETNALNDLDTEEESNISNFGKLCPPHC